MLIRKKKPFQLNNILGDPRATSRDDAMFSGERHFGAKVYFKG